jgi:hypothetical protein
MPRIFLRNNINCIMPLDSEPITTRGKTPDDFHAIVADIGSHVQFKLLCVVFITFILLCTDVFRDRILANFQGATDYKNVTSWGTTMQAMFLVLALLIADPLIRLKII